MSRNASSIADFPEVGYGEISIDLLQARFWPTKDVGSSVAINAFERSRSRGGRYRVYRHKRRDCPLEERMAPEVG